MPKVSKEIMFIYWNFLGDDAAKVKWVRLDRDHRLYASHEKLIQAVFWDKSKSLKDTSLYLPAWSEGKVVDVLLHHIVVIVNVIENVIIALITVYRFGCRQFWWPQWWYWGTNHAYNYCIALVHICICGYTSIIITSCKRGTWNWRIIIYIVI